jgi:diguanylate cyclase (GGDEF)-like protein/PAS domain S-box-containing protein
VPRTWQTNRGLRQRELGFRAIFAAIVEASDDAITSETLDGIVTSWNRGAELLYGYSAEEMIGRSVSLLEPPERNGEIAELLQTVGRGEVVRRFETSRRAKDGRIVDVALTLSPIRNETGVIVGASAVGRDVTEHKQAQQAIEESEQRFRALFDQTAVGIALNDLDGRWILANERLCQLYGYPREELLRLRFQDISHPDDLAVDLARLERMLAGEMQSYAIEKRMARVDGSVTWVEVTVSLVRDAAGQPQFTTAVVQDITERKRAEAALEHQALHDALTGLPNRTLLRDRLEQAIRQGRRDRSSFALLLLDLDRFKEVNDALGHHAGDQLLQEVARRISGALRESDTVARLGGDEFAVICAGASPEVASTTVARIQSALSRSFTLDGLRIGIAASIGIAYYPDHGEDASTLLRRADIAMYAAKRTVNRSRVYSPECEQITPVRLSLVADLRHAIQNDQLVLHYQPKVNLRTRQVEAVEALVRWRHPERGLLQPDEFIPVAEATGLIEPLSKWVINTALRQCGAWQSEGLDGLRVAVNLPVGSLTNLDLSRVVSTLAVEAEVGPSRLIVEITEGSLMEDSEHTVETLRKLHELGVSVAIDDFGTGYSSLAYLKQLPVDEIKIDRSFVLEMTQIGSVIIRSIVDLAQKLGLSVTAEGVEDETTLEALTTMGCDMAQGYHLSLPLPGEEVPGWVRRFQNVQAPATKVEASILVVDDNPVYQRLLQLILTSDGYAVTAVGDTDQALSTLQTMTPDLLLTDIRLPGRSGLDLIRQARQQTSLADTVIIALSGTPQPGDEDRARDLGCDVYARKPSSNAEVSRLVRESLARSREH